MPILTTQSASRSCASRLAIWSRLSSGLSGAVTFTVIASSTGYIKTIDIADTAVKYLLLSEKIREILKSIEDKQIDNGIGIYGKGYLKDYEVTLEDQRIAWSMANDKHLLTDLQRKIK